MKTEAHISKSLDSGTISISQVIKRMKSNPKEYENRTYYSLWYLTPMYARTDVKTPHFAFYSNDDCHPGESGGGESIEHLTTKEIIARNKCLKLRRANREGIVRFSEIRTEHPFGKRDYIGDLYGKLESDENNVLELKIDDWVSIEIFKSHKTTPYKIAYYRKENIAAIEIEFYNTIKFEGSRERLEKRIAGWLNIPLPYKRLHNPYYKSFYEKTSPVIDNKPKEETEPQPALVERNFVEPEIPLPLIIRKEIESRVNVVSASSETGKNQKPKLSLLKRFLRLLGIEFS